MIELRSAVGLLTRIPVRVTAAGGVAATGAVGALLGLAAGAPVLALAGAPLVAATLAMATLAVLSGALHLDGLADTADALAAPDPDRAEAARRDPRTGAAGAVAVTLVVVLDVTILAALIDAAGGPAAALALVIAAAGSRALPAVVTLAAGRERVRPGSSAAWFAGAVTLPGTVAAAGTAPLGAGLALLVGAGVAPLIGAVTGTVLAAVATQRLVAIRDGLDGDLLGAAVEIGFSAIALAILAAHLTTAAPP